MIISHTHRFIFFSNPKTGSESLRALLAPLNEEPIGPWRNRTTQNPFYAHMSPAEAQISFADKRWPFEAYRRITCVRNPYPRLVSLYRMIADVDGLWRLRRRMGLGQMNFSRWLVETQPDGPGGGGRIHQRWRRYGTWSAQAWTTDATGARLATDILRLEHLAEELPPLLADLNLPLRPELGHVNARAKTDWSRWYSPQTRALVADRYAWDFRRFSYS
ncbi:sulfotransferase family 2 domain-containing protein [Cognatishimia sp. MH4019]|uniref:sulfotransferase family 2 domain-containing protein n=1 Tax=Cognatishimia sp. MH4019 TaxID=2854030 RepID=UPI001CD6AFCD|nr:sulfotransferase family 2 domain-containing protein [Cognatishimia sp. MH4019]